jgi:hypothetical protein
LDQWKGENVVIVHHIAQVLNVPIEGDSARFKLHWYDTPYKNDRNTQLFAVGGKETTTMARLLGRDAHLVSYGGMAKQALSLPVSLFIFKNLTCRGFWQSHWYKQKTPAERAELMQILVNLMKEQKVWQKHICFGFFSIPNLLVTASHGRP